MASTRGPKVKIGKINATSVNFATEMVIHNNSDGARMLPPTWECEDPNRAPPAPTRPATVNRMSSLALDGSLNPEQQNTAPPLHDREDHFRTPKQVSSSTSSSEQVSAENPARSQESGSLPFPTPVQPSGNYTPVGGENDNNSESLTEQKMPSIAECAVEPLDQGAGDASNSTMLTELKLPVASGDQAEAFAAENSGDEGSADQTQLKQVGAIDSLSSEPDSLYCDAPPESLRDTNSCSSTKSSSTAACDLPESEALRAAQPASGPAVEALSALMGKRDPCTDCISTDTRTVGQTSSVYSSPDLQHQLQKGSSSDLHTDGGERGVIQADCTDEIFVILNRDTLVQDDQDPEVHVVESLPCLDLLESAQQSGVMPDGSSQLLRLKWRGRMNFDLSFWKLDLKPEVSPSSKCENLVKHLCQAFLDKDVESLGTVLKQLKKQNSVFIHSILWDGGLHVFLGHNSPEDRDKCLLPPVKQEVQSIIQQLLPKLDQDLLEWKEPTVFEEEEKEDGGPPALSCSEDRSSPASREDSPTSGQENRASFSSDDISHRLQPSPTESQLSATLSATPSRKMFGSLAEMLEETVMCTVDDKMEEKMTKMITPTGKLIKVISEQVTRQLQTQRVQAESGEKNIREIAQKVEELQKKQEDNQNTNQVVNKEMAEELQEYKSGMEQTISMLVQDQFQKMTDEMSSLGGWIRAQDEEKESLPEELKIMQKKLTEQEQKLLKAVEEKCNQQQQEHAKAAKMMMETIDKQQKDLQAKTDKRLRSTLQSLKSDIVRDQERRFEKRFKGFHAHIAQEQMKQQEHVQAQLQEVLGKLHQMEGRLQAMPPAGLDIVGRAQIAEGELGAVGGNEYSSALISATAQTTSKMKSKDDELYSNEMAEKIRLPPLETGAAAHAQGSVSSVSMPLPGVPADGQGFVPGKVSPARPLPEGNGGRKRNSKKTQPASGRERKSLSSERASDTAKQERKPDTAKQERKPDTAKQERKPDSEGETSRERRTQTGSASAQDEETYTEEDMERAEQFMDWISIQGTAPDSKDITKGISKYVCAALKEEKVPAPRAKCLDTILCLDVSESIVREGHLETVKKLAMEFVDGIEDLMDEMDLEENIAVVAVGGHARVVQHLTNDLTLVREAIESLDDRGGRSPFLQALMVCMAANKGRGGIVNVSGVYRVRPRIIFMTDGCPTDEGQETGPDLPGNLNQTKFTLVQLLYQLAAKKHRSTPKPINWVPIGQKADEKFLKSLADLSGGELVAPEEIKRLCRYYKVQQTVGRVYKVVKSKEQEFLDDGKIRDLMVAIASDTITEDEQEYVLGEIKKLQKYPADDEDLPPDDFNRVYEDQEKVKSRELLRLGTRVVRGPDWKWKNQDTDGPGTVIQHSKNDNWIHVKWDNGTHNAYRYGEEGKCDIVETQHHPRQLPPDTTKLDFGVRVVRGPAWKKENQDGNGPGTVVRCKESLGKVKVRWDNTEEIHEYYYNETKGKEVQMHMPEFARRSQSTEETPSQGPHQQDDGNTIPMWKWRDEKHQWRLYDERIAEKLEAEYKKRPTASCVVCRAGQDRRVIFKFMQEKTVESGTTTQVMREMVDEERRNDLLAIEFSLSEP